MAYECGRCFGVVKKEPGKCPKCGYEMRLTFLDSFQTPSTRIRVPGVGVPTTWERVKQVAYGLLLVHAAGVGLTMMFIVGVIAGGWEPSKLRELNFPLLLAGELCIPVIAVAVACFFACREVYLAQLVGVSVGLIGATALLTEQQVLMIHPEIFAWFTLPVCCGFVGWVIGVWKAGKLITYAEFECRLEGTWNQKAKPKVRELAPAVSLPWIRLTYGVVTGAMITGVFRWVASLIITPSYRGNVVMVGVILDKADPYFLAGAVFVAGLIAGSGSRFGLFQGILAGLLLLGLKYATGSVATSAQLVQVGLTCAILGPIGGLLGKAFFGPARVFSGAPVSVA